MNKPVADDIAAVANIDAVPTILEVICRTTGLGFAAVARVTEDRWIACAVRDEIAFGLEPGSELRVETTICSEIRDSGKVVVIDHAATDEAFCGHPTPAMYGFESYISVPIRHRNGQFFGTLCALDPRPARLSQPATIGMFKLFADLISFHLDANQRLMVSAQALADEQQRAELREQFIAILGHDLRNPLNAIDTGARLLLTMPLDQTARHVAGLIQSSAGRMTGLIENVLDFARGRLGDGLSIVPTLDADLERALLHVIAELRTAWPNRTIHSDVSLNTAVTCDPARIGQLLSNLLGNALMHGAATEPVWVEARSHGDAFELSVANRGAPIPPETRERLFQPFTRASARAGQQGLGLGLYIASEIARAHGGRLTVTSSAEETRFTFRMKSQPRVFA